MKNISIVGIGRLGLCFGLTLEKAGYNIVGCDISQDYVDSINNKTIKSPESGVEELVKSSKYLKATTDLLETINHSNVVFVVVATPSLPSGEYDHSQVDHLVTNLQKLGVQESTKHFIICCTTMPGYSDLVQERLKDYNYTVSYNPEFIAQGTILRDQASPDMVLIGEGSKEAGDILEEIYVKHTQNNPNICRMSRTEAEICKISLNCFVTTKISFANMIGDMVVRSGGDPNVVLSAIGSDSRIGNKYLRYGYGYGGPCFPRDNRALAIYANKINLPADISIATDNINNKHLGFQVAEFEKNNDKHKEIVFDTVTYKPNTTIIEESQQLAFAVELARLGYDIKIKEHPETIKKVKEKYYNLFTYEER